MGQCDQRRHSESPLEVDREEERHQQQEDRKSLNSLGRDLSPPRGADQLDRDVARGHPAALRQEFGELQALRWIDGRGLHANDPGPRLGDDRLSAGRLGRDLARIRDRAGGIGHGEQRTPLELNPEIEPSEAQRRERNEHEHAGHDEPRAGTADEVDAGFAAVETVSERGSTRHQDSTPTVGRSSSGTSSRRPALSPPSHVPFCIHVDLQRKTVAG